MKHTIERAIIPYNSMTEHVIENKQQYLLFAPVATTTAPGVAAFDADDFVLTGQTVSLDPKFESQLSRHEVRLDEHDTKLGEHDTKFSQHDTKLSEHDTKLSEHDTKLSEHDTKLSEHADQLREHNGDIYWLRADVNDNLDRYAAHERDLRKLEVYTPFRMTLDLDPTTFVLTASLWNETYYYPIITSNPIDLPLESAVVDIRVQNDPDMLILCTRNGTEIAVDMGDLFRDVVDNLDSNDSGKALAASVGPKIKELIESKINSLLDKITFEGLPDKPFGDASVPLSLHWDNSKETIAIGDDTYVQLASDRTYGITVDHLRNPDNKFCYAYTGTGSGSNGGGGGLYDSGGMYKKVTYLESSSNIVIIYDDTNIPAVSNPISFKLYVINDVTDTSLGWTPPSVGIYLYENRAANLRIYSLSGYYDDIIKLDNKYLDLPNNTDFQELSEKVNSLPDEITFEGLPDKPFEGTAPISLSIDFNADTVALKSGRTAYFLTGKTYTVDELIGAAVEYRNEGISETFTLSLSNIVHESADGMTIRVVDEYIIVAYTTNYIPTWSNTQLSSSPLPYIGVYFTEDSSGDYYIKSLSKATTVTKHLDGNFVKMYRHSIYMYTSGNPYFSARSVFISPSSKAINTVENLCNSPCCWSNQAGSSTVQFISGTVQTSSVAESEREIHSIGISKDKSLVSVTYITAYTTPLATSMMQFNSSRVTMFDYVTEV